MIDTQSEQYKAQKKFLETCAATYKAHAQERKTINILGISCSTVNMDDEHQRKPSSEKVLEDTLAYAKQYDSTVETKLIKLRDLDFAHCEANYSIQGDYCTWPCWLSQRKKDADQLVSVYNALTDWCDIVLIATPIRWGNPASLYFKMIERLNCIQTQKEMYDVDLINNQSAGFIIVGAQDGVQACLGNMFSFWTQTGFTFPKDPYIAYTGGNYTSTALDQVGNMLEKDHIIIDEMRQSMIKHQIQYVRNLYPHKK